MERSKFIVPLNLSPFALTPKLLLAKSNSNTSSNKPTPLNNEFSSELGEELTTSSMDNSTLASSCALGEPFDQTISEDAFDQSFNDFLDNSVMDEESDFDMEMYDCSPERTEDEAVQVAAYCSYTEPWKSNKVNFLNQWAENCIGKFLFIADYKHLFKCLQTLNPIMTFPSRKIFLQKHSKFKKSLVMEAFQLYTE